MGKRRKQSRLTTLINYIYMISSIYIIYNILLLGPIEPLIRYILIALIIVINIVLFVNAIFKKKAKSTLIIVLIPFIIINFLLGYYINNVYSLLSRMNKNKTIYSTSLLVKNNNNIKSINDISNINIGIINDTSSVEGYQLAKKIISDNKLENKNKFKEYLSYTDLLYDLYNNKLDAIFLPSNYNNMFSNIEKYENIDKDLKVIISEKKAASNKSKNYGTKKITKPFSILLIGIDSTKDGLENSDSFNGDSLILITFNPNTLNATILTIPRDSYVPIACFKGKYENKITHAAWKGIDCIKETVQNFTDIKIDYYAKINFKGLVDLVDSLKGIEVEVPKKLCTDNSNRTGEICIKKGLQKLNGEEALVLARNRKQLENGDIDRGLNQQIVLQGIIDKVKNINSVTEISDIFTSISKNLDMNMSTNTILSFYEVGKKILSSSKQGEDLIKLERLFLDGTGQIIYDENTKLNLWNYILNKESLNDVTNEMKYNLQLKNMPMDKSFTYSIDDPYNKTIIVKGPYKTKNVYTLLPDFTKYTRNGAIDWGKKYDINIKFNEVIKNSSSYKFGQIINQNYPIKKRIDKISDKTVTLTIVSK